ncbi:NACHT domain-containing protein [Pseudophaeobacter leonis]|uniref:NACHT domain-containing protein n=1 Tax=Pseudophaeobacter leonis TaxID=1144477 RepID=UPI0009F46774|nr:NACHT domain-containing protein [Pseudophaeobacter leonis]
MTNEIDPNAGVAATTATLIKDFFSAVSGGVNTAFWNKYQKYFPQFEQHLSEIYDRVSKVKILCSQDAPTDFDSIYVCPSLQHDGNILDDTDFLELTHAGSNLVVKSHGGSGKTFLMRDPWLSIFKAPKGRVPILIELRGLNQQTTVDLMAYLRASAVKAGSMSQEVFIEFCREGRFIFLFDGFDEIEKDQRDTIEKQILDISYKFRKCSVVVTGRPNDRFSSWSEFKTYSCCPFTYGQFSELIEKVPFEVSSKRKFQKVATENFFNKHKDFLSNPLLAQMMLMTYRDNAEIPSKLAIFYENCYLTLFLRHDALKEQLRRPKLLDQDEFRRLFSVFCFFSYVKSKPDFSEAEIRQFIGKSIEQCKFPVSVDNVLDEFLETVNLIQKDGTKYQFIHRSFQEYFAAHCAVRVLSEKSRDILSFFADRRADTVFELAFELHPDLVVSNYLIPEYDVLSKAGYFGDEAGKRDSFEELNKISFSVDHYTRKNTQRSLRTSWGPDSSYEVFSQAVERAFGMPTHSDAIDHVIFSLHDKGNVIFEPLAGSPIAKDTEVRAHIYSDGKMICAEIETDRDYKKRPKILNELGSKLQESSGDDFKEIGNMYRKRRSMIEEQMKRVVQDRQGSSERIAAIFGI